jgi:pyrimidine nucleoside transport protein
MQSYTLNKMDGSCPMLHLWLERVRPMKMHLVRLTLAVLYNGYLSWAVWYASCQQQPIDYCGGVGLLVVVTAIVYAAMFYFLIVKVYWAQHLLAVYVRMEGLIRPLLPIRWITYGLYLLVAAAVISFLVVDSVGDGQRFISLLGLFTLVLIGFIFSKHPRQVVTTFIHSI